MRSLKEVQKDDRTDKKKMGELDCGMNELMKKIYVVGSDEWGEEGWGKDGLEWYGNCGNFWPNQNEKWGVLSVLLFT